MNMVVPNEGKLDWTEIIISALATDDPTLRVRLYTVDITLDDATVLADFTEATFTGYSEYPIDNSLWTNSTLISNVAYLEYTPAPVFTCTGGAAQTVYGWYLVDGTTGHVLACAKFASARVMASGSTETLDPFQIGLQTLH